MKAQEIILDILGLALFIFSMYAFFYMGVDFYKCIALGVGGLALFVLKTSKVRSYIEKIINKKLDK